MKKVDFLTAYLSEIEQIKNTEEWREESFYPALLNFLKELCGHTIIVNPKKMDGNYPDFIIRNLGGSIVGCIEAKAPGANLDSILNKEQIARYRSAFRNVLLTNFEDFILIRDDREEIKINLLRQPQNTVLNFFDFFLNSSAKGINNLAALAEKLANLTRQLRDLMLPLLENEILQNNRFAILFRSYQEFKQTLSNNLSPKEFVDSFSQMLVYGLFMAQLKTPELTTLTLKTACTLIPDNFILIRDLMKLLDNLESKEYASLRPVIVHVLKILNSIDQDGIIKKLSLISDTNYQECFATQDKKCFEKYIKDPYVYFYENFLEHYDPELRRQMGVYYTPLPIVDFITKSIDQILKEKFNKTEGLASTDVTVLDFATGTGTFLLEMFKFVIENSRRANSGKISQIVHEHLLKNFYGFEIMVSPYTIAQIKLSEYLQDEGFKLMPDERIGVFLANTLSKSRDLSFFDSLAKETADAQNIKEKNLLVICGNPPYSNKTTSNVYDISAYKQIDGVPIKEKNLMNLSDDYVKFIRFAQEKMDSQKEGVIGIVTNNGFLENITFYGMRHSLMYSFDQILILDLHGDGRKREKENKQEKDENVFGILTGVCIVFFIKKPGLKKGIFRRDILGTREYKYQFLSKHGYADIERKEYEINPRGERLIFRNNFEDEKYEKDFWKIDNIFTTYGLGLLSKQDKMAIGRTSYALFERISEFCRLTEWDARKRVALKT